MKTETLDLSQVDFDSLTDAELDAVEEYMHRQKVESREMWLGLAVLAGLWVWLGFIGMLMALLLIWMVSSIVGMFQSFSGDTDPDRFFTEEQRREITRRDGYACARCGVTHGLEADHVTPWSWGGRTVVENGQWLCRYHNREKGARYAG